MNGARHPRPGRGAAGFTLAEVLVATAVVALAMGALLKGSGDASALSAGLRERTLAQWVAANRVTELQLQADWPDPGKSDGSETLGGREWFWVQQVAKMEESPDLRQVQIEVRLDEAAELPLTRLQAVVGSPALRAGGR